MSSEPTDHPAGSPEKIELLRRRHAGGSPLFIEGDSIARVDQRPDPDPPILFQELESISKPPRPRR